jgi:hypothetical protein
MDLKLGLDNAIHVWATVLSVIFTLGFAYFMLSLRMQENKSAFTKLGITLTILLCFLFCAAIAMWFGYSLKINSTTVSAFFVLFPCSLLAFIRCYFKYNPKNV